MINIERIPVLILLATIIVSFGNAAPTLDIPDRSDDALTGSEFYQEIQFMDQEESERRMIDEVAKGNVPDFLRTLEPIVMEATINNERTTATVYTSVDYLAIGSDEDFFRIPLGAPAAQRIADELNVTFPTRKIVNSIHEQADVTLPPRPFSPNDYDIDSTPVFWLSNQAIEEQREGNDLGLLVSGIKKDIVITEQLNDRPAPPRVAIFGWHQSNGQPIQPLSLVHVDYYRDYSHGFRLVSKQVQVGNEWKDYNDLLQDPLEHPLLSDEGVFDVVQYPSP